ncbi:hypothetical protein GEMRC1_004850 [Eukaryota sp. GEM-RC1]
MSIINTLTDEQAQVFQAITHARPSKRRNFFITGGAGSGKSYLLYCLKQWWSNAGSKLMRPNGHVFFTATTGVASTVFGGQTLHSLFGYNFIRNEKPISDVIRSMPSSVKSVLRTISARNSMLVIDEISMLTAELFNRASDIFKDLMKSQLPFGGLQVVIFGDFLQLAPIVKSDSNTRTVLQLSDFTFSSQSWKDLNLNFIELSGSIRQQNDVNFYNFLNELRLGLFDDYMKHILLKHKSLAKNIESPTKLFARNKDVADENLKQFDILCEQGNENVEFHSLDKFNENLIKSEIVKSWAFGKPNEEQMEKAVDLNLKKLSSRLNDFAEQKFHCVVGGLVMFTQNKPDLGLVNGSKGKIIDFSESSHFINVRFGRDEEPIKIIPTKFEIEVLNEKKKPVIIASRLQYPLRPCWAITVHRSQGLTIEGIEVSLNFWEYAQLYVTLSRVKNWNSIKILDISSRFPKPRIDLYQWYYSTFHPCRPVTKPLYPLPLEDERIVRNWPSVLKTFDEFSSNIISSVGQSTETVDVLDPVSEEIKEDLVEKDVPKIENFNTTSDSVLELFDNEVVVSGSDSGDDETDDDDDASSSMNDFVVNDDDECLNNQSVSAINSDLIFNKPVPKLKKTTVTALPKLRPNLLCRNTLKPNSNLPSLKLSKKLQIMWTLNLSTDYQILLVFRQILKKT